MNAVESLAVSSFSFLLSVAFYTSDQMSRCDMRCMPWRKFEWMLLRNKLPYENFALLGYYAVSSGNLLPVFWDNVLVPSSEVKNPKKACCPSVEFIQGRLSSVVSANWVYASGWERGEYGGQCSFGDEQFA